MQRLTRGIVIGASALALTATGAGVALASTDAAPAAVVAKAAHHGEHRARGEHGEFTGRGKEHRTIDFQRGTVTAVNGSSFTVRSKDGFSQTYTFGPEAKVRKDKQASTPAQVATGDRVFVRAVKEPNDLQATRVRDRGPAPAAPAAPTTTAPSGS